ncbi:hypothetical protein POM88_024378 [Heracleum sosnowskyi]|uniref:Transposase n=1 Tax=Heracleum sosnowskyi TaxID=360622 RepID=A0AAD8I1W8_9APIA|nr:hypothetical protein POM88_024376 [Heracleum sosnowskyi]KAK1377634.1 hypothetical protein POM88_024378 [Heracleum sosnowskyi]
MDRYWVKAGRMSEEYKKGVTEFCKYAAKHVKDTRFILCPCEKCLNVVEVDGLTKLEEHLRIHGIDKTYTCWTYHGEKKGERSSSNLNSNYPFIDGGDNNITVDNDCSNSSGRNDIPNVMNEELHDHPDMSERLKDDCALPLWHPWIEHIDKENVLEVLDAQWLSSSSLCLYISDTSLAKCLLGHVDKDHLLLLPYNISKHWILVAINTKTEIIYFMDPARMTNATQYKDVKTLIETAMRTFRTHNRKKYSWTAFNSFRWTNVKCPKQAFDDGIYCAYYVGCFIEDIMCSNETTVDVNVSILNVCVSSN